MLYADRKHAHVVVPTPAEEQPWCRKEQGKGCVRQTGAVPGPRVSLRSLITPPRFGPSDLQSKVPFGGSGLVLRTAAANIKEQEESLWTLSH